MSAKYTFLAWEEPEIKGSQLLVLLQLANNSNDDGISWYSVDKMAERCKVGTRTFQENLKVLESKGVVEVTRRKNKVSIYKLLLGVRNPQGADSAGEGCEIRMSGGADSADDPNKEPNKDPINKNTKKNTLDFSPLGFTIMEIAEWKGLRKSAKAPINQRAINMAAKEFNKSRLAGFTNDQILDVLSEKGWKGYKHDWLINSVAPTNQNQGHSYHDQANQAPTLNGIAYGEHADQSIFPAHLRIVSNDIPAIKSSRTAIQRSYIERHGHEISSQGGKPMESINPDVREPLELDEWERAEHRMGELPNFTDGQAS